MSLSDHIAFTAAGTDRDDGARDPAAHAGQGARSSQEQLRASESRYRLLFQNNPLPLCLVDDETLAITAVNDAGVAHYGYSRDEFLRMTVFDLRIPEERHSLRPLTSKAEVRSTRHRKKNGEIIDVEIHAHPVDLGGRPTHLVLSVDVTEKNRAWRARAETFAMLEALVDTSPVAILTVDNDNCVVTWNRAAEELFGFSAAEVVGRIPPTRPPGRDAEFAFFDEERAAGRHVKNFETQRLHKNGSLVDVLLSTATLHDANGHTIGLVGLLSDISLRKRAEEQTAAALAAADLERRRLEATLQAMPIGVWITNADGRTTHTNDAARRIWRGEAPALESVDDFEHYKAWWPETGEPVKLEDRTSVLALRTGSPVGPILAEIGRFDGTRGHVLSSAAPIRDADGNIMGTVLINVDITDRHEEEQERVRLLDSLRHNEERYRTLVEMSPDGIILHNDGIVVFANGAAARILAAAGPAQLIGMSVFDFPHPDYRAFATEQMSRLVDGAATPPAEARWQALDGTERVVEVTSMPFILSGTRTIQTVFRDGTHRHQLEDQLRQSQKMEAVGRLAGGVAHDFNNLLTVIKANVEFLLEDLDGADPRRQEATEIRNAAERAEGLTRQLLAFSRKQILQPRILDCNSIVASVKPMLSRLIGEDIVVETLLADGLGSVMADPGQIEQVVLNLAVNARDAMPHGGRILIETIEVDLDETYTTDDRSTVIPGRYVMLAVSDSGSGITPEIRSRLFEPFFTTKPTGQGTGLGLSTVYGIVKQSGGHIWVYSEIDRGTTFKIYLPRLGAATAQTSEATAEPKPTGSETVLIVEDEDALRMIARRVLTRQGYTVLEAKNGREALSVAANHPGPIHLVLTDVVMPEMSGGALSERLLAVRPQAVVLFMSGYTDGDIVRRGVLRPGMSFVQKPFTPAKLLEMVRGAIDGRRSGG